MVVFTTRSDYAIILLSELAKRSGFVSLGRLAKEKKLPYRYISRIAGTLKKNGLISSKEGVTGGYTLSKKPEEISLVHVLELFEDNIATTKCTVHGTECKREGTCELQPKWRELQKELVEHIKKYSLADFI